MDVAMKTFLDCGKRFRIRHSRGCVVLAEPDERMRKWISLWIERAGGVVKSYNSLESVQGEMASRTTHPRCLLMSLDGLNATWAQSLIKWVEETQPTTVTVVYSSSHDLLSRFYSMPRVTTIFKGDGLEDLILSLESEMQIQLKGILNV